MRPASETATRQGYAGDIEEGASTVNQLVARRRALGSRRALWFYLAAVTAIIAGLLAMHSLSLEEDQAGAVVAAAVAAPDTAADILVSGVVTPSCDETVCRDVSARVADPAHPGVTRPGRMDVAAGVAAIPPRQVGLVHVQVGSSAALPDRFVDQSHLINAQLAPAL
jgi:hypothetical protein